MGQQVEGGQSRILFAFSAIDTIIELGGFFRIFFCANFATAGHYVWLRCNVLMKGDINNVDESIDACD